MKNNLLDGLVNTSNLDMPLAEEMKEKIISFDYKTKADVERFYAFSKKMIFLNTVQNINRQNQKNIEPNEESRDFILNAKNFDELEKQMSKELKEGISTFFEGNIEWKTVEAVQEKWGSFEPILRYLGRYPELRQYAGEMVNVFTSDRKWKEWRYDQENPGSSRSIAWFIWRAN